MRFKLLVLAVCGLFAGCLQAQVGVYVLATGQHMSNVTYTYTGSTTGPNPYTGESHFSPLGFTAGAYYDRWGTDHFRFGVDVRGGISSSQKGTVTNDKNFPASPSNFAGGKIYTMMGGARGSMRTHIGAVKLDPYVQLSAGLIRTNYGVYPPINYGFSGNGTGATGNVSNFGAAGTIGADVQINPMIAWRLEASTGAVFAGSRPDGLSKSNFNVSSSTFPLQSYSMGVVFRFHRNQ